ncbi:hypothetical protein AGABI2DRAFT_115931 [Agaricus bisporus var. bisporus H97]|uniref:hypothetical protein n=1 Tax=Agaricus bisporus var. bisporus (strain H97 / ATCC MYA-4626 / FGSC 10389) TaxID=936046 RepID=UPI00029F72FF|nr:hypothetical protein AGABI2DRAFT_115931 [Agaricus bisporus var. bisporus H97]EKV48878.1 hypothetical protein AGABI2DRAFT_115931 [Agaricus bisporus var. bisporus H97]
MPSGPSIAGYPAHHTTHHSTSTQQQEPSTYLACSFSHLPEHLTQLLIPQGPYPSSLSLPPSTNINARIPFARKSCHDEQLSIIMREPQDPRQSELLYSSAAASDFGGTTSID